MRKQLLIALFLASCLSATSQKIYKINAPKSPMKIIEGKLKMGGKSPHGGSIAVNNYYMSIDGKPVVSVMGEFHFSRYPKAQWEEEIIKMKAGGVNMLSTYVFWALHEEKEGVFNWPENLDLRYFLQQCKKHDMKVIIRIGPFCHGEIRSGAIPEWIFAKPLEIRSNDPEYLVYVDRLYKEIGRQMTGLYYKDGGPVIGCQIENEMQHSAAPWAICYPNERNDYTAASWNAAEAAIGVEGGHKAATAADAGDEHMHTLLKMAKDAGIITPFYTATGWGNAAVIGNEAIPVTSAYTYPFWEKPQMSQFLMFKDIHKNPDYSPVRYNPEDFPSFCTEMGAGIQMVYNSRPIVTAKAAEGLVVRCLGSGSNGIGYYMYHGGSTPPRTGQNAFMSDEPMGVPKISYDFQAPLGEFGLENKSYRNLRLIHNFLSDFSDRLAPMETVLPEGWEKMTPSNRKDLRYAVRMRDNSGFLFMINFQDHDMLRTDMKDLQVNINLDKDTVCIPQKGTFTLPKDESVILPFNFKMHSILLKYATAQLLMKINDAGAEHYFFFAPEGTRTEYVFDKNSVSGRNLFTPQPGLASTFTVKSVNGSRIKITTLTRQQALDASKINGKLLITKATVLPSNEGATLLLLGDNNFSYTTYVPRKGFKTYTVRVAGVKPIYSYNKRGTRRMSVHFNDSISTPQVREYFLRINYVGDVAMAFMDGVLCQDEFYHGDPWMIGLKRYKDKMKKQNMTFYFRPLQGDLEFVHRDLPKNAIPDFSNGPVVKINNVEVVPEYQMEMKF